MIKIAPFQPDYLPDMAALFIANLKKLRQALPIVPESMENSERVTRMIEDLFKARPGAVALDSGRLVGYLGWMRAERFRGTERTAAYVPEWGHAAAESASPEIYRALYRAVTGLWSEQGCQAHALTLLARDAQVEKIWFWNGFGLTVVDAIRPITPLKIVPPLGIYVRKASLDDLPLLSDLEAEHANHYTQPPILMAAYEAQDSNALAQFLSALHNSIWLALDGDQPAGFMRFDASGGDTVAILSASDSITITGAYVRATARGRKIAPSLLDVALQDYATQGFERCAVDFESFNPEAAAFWPRYFEPVCLSVVRVPERTPSRLPEPGK